MSREVFDTAEVSEILKQWEHVTTMAFIDTESAAERLARAIASDIVSYNEETIVAGIRADNLFEVLDGTIVKSRQLFQSRVTPEIYARGIFERALVDALLRSKGNVPSPMW